MALTCHESKIWYTPAGWVNNYILNDRLARCHLRFAVLRYSERRATRHRIPTDWPEAAPMSLRDAFDEQID